MYKIKYHKQVIKFLQKQDREITKKILNTFENLKEDLDFSKYDIKPLKGYETTYRLRVSKYRIIFSIEDDKLLIFVIKAASRGDIYK